MAKNTKAFCYLPPISRMLALELARVLEAPAVRLED